jgi:hypothetical protein
MSDVTSLLVAATAGDCHDADKLLLLVYDESRALAAARMASEASGRRCKQRRWFTRPTSA